MFYILERNELQYLSFYKGIKKQLVVCTSIDQLSKKVDVAKVEKYSLQRMSADP